MSQIQFGTDGWRSVIAEDFTFRNLDRVAQATADFWQAHPIPGCSSTVIVGYDRRFFSDLFARRTAEIMAANGFSVVLTPEPTPTPAVSLAVKECKAVGGVMITASHNPPRFNGYKIKAWYGGSAEPAICQQVEQQLDARPAQALSFAEGLQARRILLRDLKRRHLRAVKRQVDFALIARSKIRFAHDALFGVGAGCFDALLANTNCRVTTLNAEHDPLFGGINPEPVAQNYGPSAAYLRRNPHDLCLVTDGDADRVGGMDGRGNPLSTHQLICLLLNHFVVRRQGEGRIVKALTTTSMVDKMCAQYGLQLVETGVGFKYICAEMLQGDVLLGFEESGGIGFAGHIPERDGILAGMMLLEMLAVERQAVSKLLKKLERQFGPHHYSRIDIHFPLEKRRALMNFCQQNPPDRLLRSPLARVATFDGVKYIAENGCWLMLRGSGTEPVLRIYAEASSPMEVRRLLKRGIQMSQSV